MQASGGSHTEGAHAYGATRAYHVTDQRSGHLEVHPARRGWSFRRSIGPYTEREAGYG
jgi:hypothetical protein